jgi:hypothetical protein
MMPSQYDPLGPFLQRQAGDRIPVTFAEIESALGFPLPRSKRYPAWWSNSPTNNPMTRVWLEAGFTTEQVDTASERLVFRRNRRNAGGGAPKEPSASPAPPGGMIARLQAALAGTVRYAPGFDPTEPTGEIWDAER